MNEGKRPDIGYSVYQAANRLRRHAVTGRKEGGYDWATTIFLIQSSFFNSFLIS